MEEFKIPKKLINMCTACVQKTRSTVRIEGTLSSFFRNNTGIKQGNPLSLLLFNLALQKVIQNIKMVPSGIKIGKDKLNVSAYADNIVLIRTEIEKRQLFVETENNARKLGLHINQEKTKHMIVEWKNSSKQTKIGHLTIKNLHLKEWKILNI